MIFGNFNNCFKTVYDIAVNRIRRQQTIRFFGNYFLMNYEGNIPTCVVRITLV